MAKKFIRIIKENQALATLIQTTLYLFIKLLINTYRIQITNKKATPIHTFDGVFYTWHQNIIAATAFFVKQKSHIHCIVSPSHDGKIVGNIAQKLGLRVLYGSAHKNPISLTRKSLEVLKTEKKLFLIGDGSRGPAKKLQPGPIYLSKKTNLPLVFIDCKVQWCITLHKSWDKFQIPLPFSKIWIELKPCSFT